MPRYTYQPPDEDDAACLHLCLALSALEYGVPGEAVWQFRKRGAMLDFARQVAFHLTHSVFGISHTRLGALAGRHPSTVSHACRVVEAEAEDAVFAARLDRLQAALRDLTRGHDAVGRLASRSARGRATPNPGAAA